MKFLPKVSADGALFYGDNLPVMQQLLNIGYKEQFDMIYFDGPFNSGWVFSIYNEELEEEIVDPWNEAKTLEHFYHPDLYRENYRKRIIAAKELLKDQGILVFHTSQKEGHYLKVILDEVFGSSHFLGEMIWKFSDGPAYQKGQFGLNHETLFFYAKTKDFFKRPGISFSSVWDDLGTYEQMGAENTYYATQKPEKLMERILHMTTEEQALVGDFYCGSGTLPYVAEKMNRRWMASDHSRISIQTTLKRLAALGKETTVHHLMEDFNPDYLQGQEYTKHSDIPFSLDELEGLKQEMKGLPVTINAYEYAPDIDLIEDEKLRYQIIMPSGTSQRIIHRPVLVRGKNGQQLYVNSPKEWIQFHLKHGTMEEQHYVIDEESVQERVQRLFAKINGNWIQSQTEYEDHDLLTDIFGYSYRVSKLR